MLRKLLSRIANNFGLKILATVFAISLWLIVVNVEDPESTKLYTIPVAVENESFLTDIGKTYEVLGASDTISFSVTGKRSVIEELSESDFKAVADLRNIDEQFSTVPVVITPSRYKNQITITKRNSYMSVSVENLITEEFEIDVVTWGEPATGFKITDKKASPGKISVTGPESLIESITKAKVDVDVANADESIISSREVMLLNADGDVLEKDRLSLNRNVVDVDILIRMEKEIPISVITTGSLPEGYELDEVTTDITGVLLRGTVAELGQVREIQIEDSQLNLTGKTASFKVELELEKYLPEGVWLAADQPKTIEVRVKIKGLKTQEYEMPVSNISIHNLAEQYNLQFNDETVTVTVKGYEDELEMIDANKMMGDIDASQFQEGTFFANVTLQGDYALQTSMRVSVTVSKITDVLEEDGTSE